MITRSLRLTAPSFWTWVMIAACVMLAVLLFLPILSVFLISFEDAETGRFTLENYVQIFTRRYYVSALSNTLIVGFAGMIGALSVRSAFGLLHVAFSAAWTDADFYDGRTCIGLAPLYRRICLDHASGQQRRDHQRA